MPNHVINRFIVCDDYDELKKLILKDNEVDFNVLKPMPYSLLITSSFDKLTDTLEANIEKAIEEHEKKNLGMFQLNKFIDENLKNNAGITTHQVLMYFNKKYYGSTTWYEWANKNWGTKWNAYEQVVSRYSIQFQTAWSTPQPWLEELAKHIDFTLAFSDEDRGSNLGFAVAVDGKLTMNYEDKKDYSEALAYVIHDDEENFLEDIREYNKDLTEKELQDQLEAAILVYNDYVLV